MQKKENPMVILRHDGTDYSQDMQKSAAFRIVTEMAKRGYDIFLLYPHHQNDSTMITSRIFGDENSLNIFKTVYEQIAQTINETISGEDPDAMRFRRSSASELAQALHSKIKDVVEKYPGMVLSSESSF